ncbi:MAG: hypothetical protein U1B30_13800 [Pseudomonadota bacterium]|nr:hypothetical protein [Pseudomonadota bacterium]
MTLLIITKRLDENDRRKKTSLAEVFFVSALHKKHRSGIILYSPITRALTE